ncbi:hypothetical protein PMIN03_012536 [Paraphaeosphaeria minitans]
MEDLKTDNLELKAAVEEVTAELSHVKAQLVETKAQAEALANNLETQLSRMQVASDGSPTYADIARTPPDATQGNSPISKPISRRRVGTKGGGRPHQKGGPRDPPPDPHENGYHPGRGLQSTRPALGRRRHIGGKARRG